MLAFQKHFIILFLLSLVAVVSVVSYPINIESKIVEKFNDTETSSTVSGISVDTKLLKILPKYEFGMLVILKNEEMVLEEFLQHYIWQGVQHFYMIDNGSTDRSKNILEKYINSGLVSYFYLPELYKQKVHYQYVLDNFIRNNTKWLLVCDVDEYIYHKSKDQTLYEYVSKLDENKTSMVVIYFYLYGSSGNIEQPESIRHSFLWRAKEKDRGGPKSIVNVKYIDIVEIHDEHTFNTEIDLKKIEEPEQLQFNHYKIMSKEYFSKVKMTRGDVVKIASNSVRNWKYFEDNDIAEVFDDELSDILHEF